MKSIQREKAELLLKLHHDDRLLILPNVWDILGAKLLESLGFEAVATASASVAYSRGLDDGEVISFEKHLKILRGIAQSVRVPVTADIERGYAETTEALDQNIERLLEAGIVGINIEDSTVEGGALISIESQCKRIAAARKAAERMEVPLVINARTDVFISEDFASARVDEGIRRAKAYSESGADCTYPIACTMDELKQILDRTETPINVLLNKNALSLKELERLGVARVSIGPALLRSSVTKIKEVAESLKNYGKYDVFTEGVLTSNDIQQIIAD